MVELGLGKTRQGRLWIWDDGAIHIIDTPFLGMDMTDGRNY